MLAALRSNVPEPAWVMPPVPETTLLRVNVSVAQVAKRVFGPVSLIVKV